MDFYQFLIPRLNGEELEKGFSRYLELVRKGVAGFIVFGGELEVLRQAVVELQSEAALPLVIASDLEQGLGQQVRGGTLFPPAMALKEASGYDPDLPRKAFAQMAEEAAYAGINTILAPVLDINTNPENPIICTRAFCETPETVSALGTEMIRTIQATGVKACGKHFPGHGDTDIDSHIRLPVVNRTIEELEAVELAPFRAAIRAGVSMLMPGHLSVPALDPAGVPVSLSAPAVRHLREKLGFEGIIITDAMNMGGLGAYLEPGASTMALNAGVDLLLHPEEPDKLAADLAKAGISPSPKRLVRFRKTLLPSPSGRRPSFDNALSLRLTEKAVKIEGRPRPLKKPFVVILSDEAEPRGREFAAALGAGHLHFTPGSGMAWEEIPRDSDLIVAVFSSVRAWKGGTASWIRENVRMLARKARMFVAFGNPYTLREVRLDDVRAGAVKVYAYWDSPEAQKAVAEKLLRVPG